MSKDVLIKLSKELGFSEQEIAVPIDYYFSGNNVIGSIMPNSYPNEVDPQKFYSFLKKLKQNENVQEILVRICEIDDEWPYTDSIYVYTCLSKDELEKKFKPFPADEIYEGWMYNEPNGRVAIIEPNKVFTIWWD